MKILVTFALEMENRPWRRLREFARTAEGPWVSYDGEVAGTDLRFVLTGMGPQQAKQALRHALGWNPDLCIATGLAGSLRSVYRCEEILVAREVMQLEGGRSVASDPALFALAEKHGARGIERLLSSERMVLTAEGKARLGRMAEAVDMESCAILSEAAARGIPGIAIRVISDASDQDLPLDFQAMLDGHGNLQGAKLARALLRRPHKLPGLMRVGRDSRRAAVKLAQFLDAFVNDLALRTPHPAETGEAMRA